MKIFIRSGLLFLYLLFSLVINAHAQKTSESDFWRVQFFLKMDQASFTKEAITFLPRSTETQKIISLKKYAPNYDFTEENNQNNLKITWHSNKKKSAPDWIIYDSVLRITPKDNNIILNPSHKTAISDLSNNYYISLSRDENKLIKSKLQNLGITNTTAFHEKIRIIYDYILNSIKLKEKSRKNKSHLLARILKYRTASQSEKLYLFRCFASFFQVPSRVANGILLQDRSMPKEITQWTQLFLNNSWFDFDLENGHFISVPENYLFLFFGEKIPFLKVSQGIKSEFQFVAYRISEESAFENDDLIIPQSNLFDKSYFKKLTKRERYMKNAFGNIAIFTDQEIPEGILEKIYNQGKRSDARVSFYNAPYESLFFRGSYLAKLLNHNYSTVRKADALLILSEDDAGLYALFDLARSKKKLSKTTIFLSGNFSKPVAKILGYTLYKLLKPKEIFLISENVKVERAWDIIKDNILDGIPIKIVSKKWNLTILDLSHKFKSKLDSWRHFIVDSWVKASKAQIHLESIYLILILPIIALVIVFIRNIIGLDTFGTFTPVIISIGFLKTGLLWGIILFAIIVASGILFRKLFQSIHIHVIARMAMLITMVSITMIALMVLGIHLEWGALINVSILPMVIMAGIIENFTRSQMELGSKEALRLTIYTLFVSSISYLIIDVTGMQSLILVFPEWILGAIIFSFLIGRWKGIRLTEYLRFYKIVGPHHQESQK